MMRRIVACWGLVACLAATAYAAPGSKPSAPASRSTQPKAMSQASGARKDAGTAPDRSAGAPRTLEDIHIEGEIPVPQVLFITARDQRRFTQFHHRRYLKTSLQIGEETMLPSRIAFTRKPTAHPSPR